MPAINSERLRSTRPLLFVLAVGAANAAALTVILAWGDIVQEDAYISFRYARHFADGYGLVYNPGERVEGYSNLLWTLAIAAAAKAGASPEATGRILSAAACLGAITTAAWVGRRLLGDAGGFLVAAALAANGALLVEGAQGLETCWYVLLVTAGAARAGREYADPTLPPLSTIPLALAVLTRADGFIPALGLTPFYVTTFRANRRRLGFWFAGWASVLAATTLGRYLYYGAVVPNTFYVKVAPRPASFKAGLSYTVDFIWRFTPVLALAPLAARRRRECLPWAGVMAAVGLYVIAIGGDMRETFRFYLPLVPLLLMMGVAALRDVADAAPWIPRGARVAIAAAFVLTPSLQFSPLWRFAREYALPAAEHRAAGRWLRENAPPGATLATSAAGIIPYYSSLPTVDILGLNDALIARTARRVADRPGHELAAPEVVLNRNPTYILIYEGVFSRWPLSREEVAAAARYPANVALVSSPRLHQRYVLSHAEVMPGVYFNYFVRADLASP